MGNTIIRAEGQATFAMVSMIIPALVNIALDFVYKITGFRAIWSSCCNGHSYFTSFLLFFGLYIKLS
jgi:Na+-driven multidrug efflux pump